MPKLNSKGTADCGDACSPLLHIIPEKCLSLCMKAKPSSQRSFQGSVVSERARTASHTGACTSASKGPKKGMNGLLGQRRSWPPNPDTGVTLPSPDRWGAEALPHGRMVPQAERQLGVCLPNQIKSHFLFPKCHGYDSQEPRGPTMDHFLRPEVVLNFCFCST